MTGRRAFGSVRQRTNGKWEARYMDSRREVHYRYFVTKAEATAHLAMTEADMLRGDWLDPRLGRVTVAEWADMWMQSKRDIRARTRELYTYLIRVHIVPTFGPWQLAHVTADDVEVWMTGLRANPKLAVSTEVKALRVFRQMMQQAVRYRRIAYNPCEHIAAPKDKPGEMLFITPAQVADLAEVVGESYAPWRAMVLLSAYGGLRWGECVGLPVRHVDELHSRVRVEQQLYRDGAVGEPKSALGKRWVKLPGWVMEELKAVIDARSPAADLPTHQAELVFLTTAATAMVHQSDWLRRTWRPSVIKALPAPLHKLRFHDLRHTAVAIALDSAAKAGHPLNPKQLQERMGHSTIRLTLDRYGHLFDGHDDKVVEAMTNPFTDRVPRHLRVVQPVA